MSSFDSFNDAYRHVKASVDSNNTETLKNDWNANPYLNINYRDESVIITDNAQTKLYDIAEESKRLNREISFYFIELNDEIIDVLKCDVGSSGRCEWVLETENFNIYRQYSQLNQNHKLGIGHTHPSGYGSIFSNVSDETSRYGLDFNTQDTHITNNPSTASNKHILLSPNSNNSNQMGIFEVNPQNATLTYRPWELEGSDLEIYSTDDGLEIYPDEDLDILSVKDPNDDLTIY